MLVLIRKVAILRFGRGIDSRHSDILDLYPEDDLVLHIHSHRHRGNIGSVPRFDFF
ncbi:hypothetical protein AGR2A_Cc110140 [Agrobacterium genomosp. 2 str. CFBP 5494]|uniref:Uncharacterized protein n=1 Tax=Agrobacterium genomosp. 2 str. CFBP 5494 TaxID=1183436 RepID=A0A9W5EXL0_9HYPH|nr:hypothetical protein AGR2A_Cc110140 [Agrobacterium genomosp. 2 str. CFBP 5494]